MPTIRHMSLIDYNYVTKYQIIQRNINKIFLCDKRHINLRLSLSVHLVINSNINIDYNFVDDLPEEYTCQVCMKLLKEPQITDCCGQHFCRACLDRWFKKQDN